MQHSIMIAADVDVWWLGKVDADVFAAWGQVIGAIATVAAVLLALGIAIRDGHKFRREAEIAEGERARAEQERQRAEHERERAEAERQTVDAKQARLVTLHTVVEQPLWTKSALGVGRPKLQVKSRIVNDSSEAVMDVVIDGIAITYSAWGRRPDTVQIANPQAIPNPLVPGVLLFWLEATTTWPDDDLPATDEVAVVITFSFTDANGKRWQRVNRGAPVRVVPTTVAKSA